VETKTNDYLSDLPKYINSPVVVWNKEREIIIFNKAFVRMSGRTEAEMIGQPLDVLFPEKGRSGFLQKIENTSGGEGREGVEIPILHKDGGIRMGLWNSSAIYGGDGRTPVATISSGQDITERKRLEAQLLHGQKMEAIGTLAGGIAHDFNNVLQIVSGYIQLLLQGKAEDDPDRRYLNQIDRSTQGAAKLVKQLLIFSRKVESRLRPVYLNQEVRRVEELLARVIPGMISIETCLSDDLKIINADPTQLEQVIMNLAVNAREAMPEGGRLVVETENAVLDEEYCKVHLGAVCGRYVLLTISDTGCGMGREALEHIFEPFYTTKEVGKGTGLGLATVYGIVKNHNGYTVCYSEPGQGTVFKVYFPVLGAIENVEQAYVEHEKVNEVCGGNETILLVDDEKSILDTTCDILDQHGYTVISAETGEEAVEIYKREGNRIDLAILDIGMPGMGGHKCFRELLKINPEIKVLIATGYSANGKVKETLESGAAGFIGKPYRLIDMVKKVREVLDGG